MAAEAGQFPQAFEYLSSALNRDSQMLTAPFWTAVICEVRAQQLVHHHLMGVARNSEWYGVSRVG